MRSTFCRWFSHFFGRFDVRFVDIRMAFLLFMGLISIEIFRLPQSFLAVQDLFFLLLLLFAFSFTFASCVSLMVNFFLFFIDVFRYGNFLPALSLGPLPWSNQSYLLLPYLFAFCFWFVVTMERFRSFWLSIDSLGFNSRQLLSLFFSTIFPNIRLDLIVAFL